MTIKPWQERTRSADGMWVPTVMQEEIDELRARVAELEHRVEITRKDVMYQAGLEQERQMMALEAKLAALEKQEPVATIRVWPEKTSGFLQYDLRGLNGNFKEGNYTLYLAAGAKP